MAYFKCTVEILVNIDENEHGTHAEWAASDLIGEALTHNLRANGVINDWQYAKDGDTYMYCVKVSKEEAKRLFGEFQE